MDNDDKINYILSYQSSFTQKIIPISTEEGQFHLKLQIWDYSPGSSYDHLYSCSGCKLALLGISGVIIVFDSSKIETIENIPNWIEVVFNNNKIGKIPVLIIGNQFGDNIDNLLVTKIKTKLIPLVEKYGAINVIIDINNVMDSENILRLLKHYAEILISF